MRNISHALITKVVVFLIAVVCITGITKAIIDMEVNEVHLSSINQDNYFESWAFAEESYNVISSLAQLIGKYKSEEYILSGKTLTEDDSREIEEELYNEYGFSYKYNSNEEGNRSLFEEKYENNIKSKKDERMKVQVREFYRLLNTLEANEGIVYYASDGEHVFSNSELNNKEQFESFKAYMLFEDYQQTLYPNEVDKSRYYNYLTQSVEELNPQTDVIYLAFRDSFLQEKIAEWEKDKAIAKSSLNEFIVFFAGFLVSFVYLIIVIGRTPSKDKEIQLHVIDKLYNDLNMVIVFCFISMWIALLIEVDVLRDIYMLVTVPIFSIALLMVLSLIKHIKNRTFLQHTLIYQIIKKVFLFVKNVFNSGSTGVKVVLLVIGYPVIVAATFFMFPITIGVAVWLALKKVKLFNRIKEGVEQIKNGDLHHRIEVDGKGEFSRLAENINSITDGLKKSVDSEIKSERLKTELITNVSHDIRTPLTSIITYVDLLKVENDPEKMAEYIEVLDQKSKRLKHLTDDLFEAAKASSGSMPVQLERIDIVSLLTQGIGEMDEKIEASALNFKLSYPTEKVYVKADGKLLWRSVENLFSNIFKYAQPASRVYIDVEDLGNEILVIFKNISAYELNISADELMERFKRGDESRSSQGSGLGLSIAESLIHIQHGKFLVQVDGDLFKAMIYLPKFLNE